MCMSTCCVSRSWHVHADVQVSKIIADLKKRGDEDVCIVVSAPGDATDDIIEAVNLAADDRRVEADAIVDRHTRRGAACLSMERHGARLQIGFATRL